jgi:excinuclease UvrABC helicase subunit UvrB
MLLFSNIEDAKSFIKNYNNRKVVFESLIEDIQDALIFGLDFITLFKYEKEDMNHFLYSDGWIKSLNNALIYFEENEEYEKCAEIRDLITVLKDSFYLL